MYICFVLKRLVLFLFMWIACVPFLRAQEGNRVVDSLLDVVRSSQGRERVEALLALSWEMAGISFDDGIAYGDQAAKEAYVSGFKDLEAKAYYRNGYLYLSNYDLDLSSSYLKRALPLYQELGDKAFLFEVYWNLALGELLMGNLDTSHVIYESAFDIASEMKDSVAQYDVLNNIAVIFYEKGQIDEAFDSYLRAKRIAEFMGDSLRVMSVNQNLATLYFELGNWEVAARLYKAILPKLEEEGNIEHQVSAYRNLGLIYERALHDSDSALYYLQVSNALSPSPDRDAVVSENLNDIAEIYMQQGKSQEAEPLFQRALSIAEALGHARGKQSAYLGLSDISYKRGDYKAALDYLEKCVGVEQEHGAKLYETMIKNRLVMVYARMGLYDKMESAFHELEALNEENQSEVNRLRMEENRMQFNFEELIRQNKEMSETQDGLLRQMKRYKLAFFGVLAVAVCLLLALLVADFRERR